MWISLLMDGCVIALVVVMLVFGMKKGFFASLIGLISSLLSVVAAAFLTSPVTGFIYDAMVHSMITDKVSSFLNENVTLPAGTAISAVVDKIAEALRAFSVPFVNLSGVSANDIGVGANTMTDVSNNLVNNVVGPQIQALLSIVVFVILLFLCGIVIRFVAKILSKTLNMLPLVGTANRLLGGVLGACKGVILCYILVTVIKLLMNYYGTGFPITPAVMEASKLAGFLFRYTIV